MRNTIFCLCLLVLALALPSPSRAENKRPHSTPPAAQPAPPRPASLPPPQGFKPQQQPNPQGFKPQGFQGQPRPQGPQTQFFIPRPAPQKPAVQPPLINKAPGSPNMQPQQGTQRSNTPPQGVANGPARIGAPSAKPKSDNVPIRSVIGTDGSVRQPAKTGSAIAAQISQGGKKGVAPDAAPKAIAVTSGHPPKAEALPPGTTVAKAVSATPSQALPTRDAIITKRSAARSVPAPTTASPLVTTSPSSAGGAAQPMASASPNAISVKPAIVSNTSPLTRKGGIKSVPAPGVKSVPAPGSAIAASAPISQTLPAPKVTAVAKSGLTPPVTTVTSTHGPAPLAATTSSKHGAHPLHRPHTAPRYSFYGYGPLPRTAFGFGMYSNSGVWYSSRRTYYDSERSDYFESSSTYNGFSSISTTTYYSASAPIETISYSAEISPYSYSAPMVSSFHNGAFTDPAYPSDFDQALDNSAPATYLDPEDDTVVNVLPQDPFADADADGTPF